MAVVGANRSGRAAGVLLVTVLGMAGFRPGLPYGYEPIDPLLG